MLRLFGSLLAPVAIAFSLSGCLLLTETPITPDAKVDARLAGAWKMAEEFNDGEEAYLIIEPLKKPDGSIDRSTYSAYELDFSEPHTTEKPSKMLLSTKRLGDHHLLIIRQPEDKNEAGRAPFENWVLDYEIQATGELIVRVWSPEEFEDMHKIHPIPFEAPRNLFSPVTLKGDEKTLLAFYGDPKVRAFLSLAGKYQKTQVPKP